MLLILFHGMGRCRQNRDIRVRCSDLPDSFDATHHLHLDIRIYILRPKIDIKKSFLAHGWRQFCFTPSRRRRDAYLFVIFTKQFYYIRQGKNAEHIVPQPVCRGIDHGAAHSPVSSKEHAWQ